MSKWTQQMPLLMEVQAITLLTDKDVKQIKGYIEQGNILDVQFKDASGEVMSPLASSPRLRTLRAR